MRRLGLICVCAAAVAAVCAATANAASVFVVTGRGWGHGVGMSQWGAYGYARHGWTYKRILAHYYPGTRLSSAPLSQVRVLLAAGQPRADVACAGPIRVSDGSGRSHLLDAGTYGIGPGLKLPVGRKVVVSHARVKHRHHTKARRRVLVVRRALRPPLVLDCPSAPLVFGGRSYHGLLTLYRAGRRLDVVNTVSLENYVRGVVAGEMPWRWSLAALEAQAVAARSYALATLKPRATYDLYNDTRSQVYGGIAYETPRSNLAVARTSGRVLTWNGRVATTFFFSTSGGRTADVHDVWPAAAYAPYLRSVVDPYEAGSPHLTWGPFVYTDHFVAARVHARSRRAGLRLVRTRSGIVRSVQLLGRRVAGADFRRALGLDSAWFDVAELTLTRSAPRVVFGGKVVVAARVSGAGAVRLQSRVGFGRWRTLEVVRRGARVAVEPRGRTLYRLAGRGFTGPVVGVAVAPRLHVQVASARSLDGVVAPRSRGRVTVWRRTSRGWKVVAHPQLDARGGFHAPVQLRPGGYRVTVGGDGRLASATTHLRLTQRLLASR